MHRSKIALVQRAPTIPWAAEIRRGGYELFQFAGPELLLRSRQLAEFGVIVLSEIAGGTSAALEAARKLKAIAPSIPIILIAMDSCENSAISALKIGIN